LGIIEPKQHLGRGDEIVAAMSGTCGAPVSWAINRRGFLTAGHVASTSQVVHDAGAKKIGDCALSLDLANNALGMDVAIVELPTSGTYAPAGSPSTLLPSVQAHQAVAIHSRLGHRGPRHTQLRGMFSWLYFPAPIAGSCADLFFTTQEVTQPGDSGSLATDPASGNFIGHVVGSMSQCGTLIQDLDSQLRALRTFNGFKTISI
jgi:hypothetical protein